MICLCEVFLLTTRIKCKSYGRNYKLTKQENIPNEELPVQIKLYGAYDFRFRWRNDCTVQKKKTAPLKRTRSRKTVNAL